MPVYMEFGSTVQKGNGSKVTFVWDIPNFLNLLKGRLFCFNSPRCFFSNSSWHLTVFPRVRGRRAGSISLYQDKGEAKTINYTLEFKRSNDADEKIVTDIGKIGKNHSFFGSLNIQFNTEELISYNKFTISCTLEREENHALEAGSISPHATQPEVQDSVSREENSPRSEESASFDVKGCTRLSEHMKELLIHGNDYDLKICVKNKEFPAHRAIIKARSPVFAMMLSHDTKENKTGTIRIEDCDPEAFDEFLLYVYTGKTENLTPSKAVSLYYVADKYDFPILKERCVSLLKTSLSVTSICDVIVLATKHKEKNLLQTSKDYFARNIKQILSTVEWQRFMSENPVDANEILLSSMEILFNKN